MKIILSFWIQSDDGPSELKEYGSLRRYTIGVNLWVRQGCYMSKTIF